MKPLPKNKKILSLSQLFIYGLAFIVLWEWLRPLPVITDTGNIHIFVLFTLFCFVMMYVRFPSYISVPAIFIVMMYSLHMIFFEGPFVKEGFATLIWFGEDIAQNVGFLFDLNLENLSFEFRSFLLLLVLAITSYLVHFWIRHLRKIFLFLIITIIYVTVIDTFTDYDATTAIIRLVVAGFFLLSLLFKMRLEEKEEVVHEEFRGKGWTNILTVMIAFAAVLAFFAPKYEPYWPDPVPVVRGVITGDQGIGSGSTTRTIGYGENDERLGGGFAHDDTVVFTAVANRAHYWRGESKEIYTGRGWESVDHEVNKTFRYSDYYDEKVAVQLYERGVPKEAAEATITMADGYRFWHFFYPGQLLSIQEEALTFDKNENQNFRYLIDYVSGKVGTTTENDGDPRLLAEYTFDYQYPTFVIDTLKKNGLEDPEHIQNVYLQLPEIPDRVGELASEITEEYDNRYDKVKAIEGYFGNNQFKYETTNVAIPGPDQDYVDQFLFETQQGYCDNYSTSMVVMLRTLEIPARWVKGFTQGEVVERLDGGLRKYEISNANAHSWVEVYFPEVGWVPFEPTRGFDHSYDFVEEAIDRPDETDTEENDSSQPEVPDRQQDPENPFLPLEEENDRFNEVGAKPETDSNLNKFQFPIKYLFIVMVILGICYVFYKNWKRIITNFILQMYKWSSNQPHRFRKAYERLLWLLELNGYERYRGETLREYAKRIDSRLSTREMQQLTQHYEKLYYGNAQAGREWEENRRSWELIVKKMSS